MRGLVVQQEDVALAPLQSGYESRPVHQVAPVVYDG